MSDNTKIEIISSIENGTINRNRKLFIDILKRFEGKEIKLTIQRNFRKRTNPMNAFYYGVICPIVAKGMCDVGIPMDYEGAHRFLAGRFLREKVYSEKSGDEIEIIKSTTSLTTVQFQEYWIQIREFADEFLGVFIPDPDPSYFENPIIKNS